MKELIGNEIGVYLKSSSNKSEPEVSGMLIEVTDGELYIQGTDVNNPFLWVVPRENVKYCTTYSLPAESRTISEKAPERISTEQVQSAHLLVYINEELWVDVLVPPTFDMSSWNEGIVRTLAGNSEFQQAIANKVQKSIDYYPGNPGKVYITIVDNDTTTIEPPNPNVQNTFSMGGDMANKYLSPSETVARFNTFLKPGGGNE